MIELSKATQLAWRRLLNTEEGKEGMLFLREKTPSIAKGDSYGIAFDAGRAEGFKAAIDTISDIIAVRQQKEENESND